MLKWYQCYVIGRFCDLFCLLHCRNWKSMALMSVCNCVISVKKCFLSPNNGFLRFCQGKTQIPIKNDILNSTNRITTVLCQKCLAQQAHIIRASTLHPSSTILLLSYIFLCEQKKKEKKKKRKAGRKPLDGKPEKAEAEVASAWVQECQTSRRRRKKEKLQPETKYYIVIEFYPNRIKQWKKSVR